MTGAIVTDAPLPAGLGGSESRGRVAFSPDGTRLALVVDYTHAESFDAATGGPLALAAANDGERTFDAAFDAQGRLVTLESDRAAVRDAATGQVLNVVPNPNGHYAGALAADGSAVAWATQGFQSANGIQVYSTLDASLRRTVNAGPDPVDDLTLTPDGTLAVLTRHTLPRDPESGAWRETREARVLDPTGTLIAALPGPAYGSLDAHLELSPGGARLALGGKEGAAQLWTVAPGARPSTLEDGPVLPLTFHLTATYVSGNQYTFSGTLDAGSETNLPVQGTVYAGSGFSFQPGRAQAQATMGATTAQVGENGSWGELQGHGPVTRPDGTVSLGLQRAATPGVFQPVVLARQP